jgi:hypothetical protein
MPPANERTAAYQEAHRWLETGTEGLPVTWVGGSLRVPAPSSNSITRSASPPSAAGATPRPHPGRGRGAGQGPGHSSLCCLGRPPHAGALAQGGLPFTHL